MEEILEKERITHALKTSVNHKEEFGQYFTPYPIANFMSSLFPVTNKKIKLLDPGAGIGTLSCSFMERMLKEKWDTPELHVSAYDIDKDVYSILNKNIASSSAAFKKADYEIFSEDFLAKTSFEYSRKVNETYTHVIMNPPHEVVLAVFDVVFGDMDQRLVHDADMRHEGDDFLLADRKIAEHTERNLQVAALHGLASHGDGVEGEGVVVAFEEHVLEAQLTEYILVAASCEEAESAGKDALQLVEIRQLPVADDKVGAEAEAKVQIVLQIFVLQLYLLPRHGRGEGHPFQCVAMGGVQAGTGHCQQNQKGEDSISHRCRGLVRVSSWGC